MKKGRKKISCSLGENKILFSCWVYPLEYNELKSYYKNKIKVNRKKFQTKEEK